MIDTPFSFTSRRMSMGYNNVFSDKHLKRFEFFFTVLYSCMVLLYGMYSSSKRYEVSWLKYSIIKLQHTYSSISALWLWKSTQKQGLAPLSSNGIEWNRTFCGPWLRLRFLDYAWVSSITPGFLSVNQKYSTTVLLASVKDWWVQIFQLTTLHKHFFVLGISYSKMKNVRFVTNADPFRPDNNPICLQRAYCCSFTQHLFWPRESSSTILRQSSNLKPHESFQEDGWMLRYTAVEEERNLQVFQERMARKRMQMLNINTH